MTKPVMKIWLLAPIDLSHITWRDYDVYHGFVIAATTEAEAREIACRRDSLNGSFWTDKKMTSCRVLRGQYYETACVILRDFKAG